MQTTIDAYSLKSFTRALVCLSRYGEDLVIHSSTDALTLSTTNSAKSAFARFRYHRSFFSKYSIDATFNRAEPPAVTAQLAIKSIISILKHRTVDRTAEKCELVVSDGPADEDDDDDENAERDSLESKLTLRLYCKHGVIKTHRLLLSVPDSLLAPPGPDASCESSLTIGPRAVKGMLEHFPVPKGSKSDSRLIWKFTDTEVNVKTQESSMDSRNKAQLSSEITISSEEFDAFSLYAAPLVLAFHLKEFNGTIAFADSMGISLDLRVTNSAEPLFVDVEGDNFEGLFAISTSQVPGAPAAIPKGSAPRLSSGSVKKREYEDTPTASNRLRKPMKVAYNTDAATFAHNMSTSQRPPSSASSNRLQDPLPPASATIPLLVAGPNSPDPLFLPTSQLSAAEHEALSETGWGIENMTAQEFDNMFDYGDMAGEIGSDGGQQEGRASTGSFQRDPSSDMMEPSQSSNEIIGTKSFKQLFDD